MSNGERTALIAGIYIIAFAVFAAVWSAHDARVYTTERFKAAVGAGLSCQGYYGEICTKITPVSTEVKK